MQQPTLFPHKDSSDSSNIYRTPGMHPQVNVKVRRRNQQSLSAFQSLFGQLNDPLDEDNTQMISEQAAVFRRSGSSLENSLFISNGRISFDAIMAAPLENKNKDDSFFSCASEFEKVYKDEDDLDNQLEQQLILENIHDNKNEHTKEISKKVHQITDHEEDDEFKSVCGDLFESSILSAKTGSSQTQFYTPKQLSLDGNQDNNNEKNNQVRHQSLQLNRESLINQNDITHNHIVCAANKQLNTNSNLQDKHMSNRTTAAQRSSIESTSKNNKNTNQFCLNHIQSPFQPEKPQPKSKNAPNYLPPPLALSIDVMDSQQISGNNNNNQLNLNNSQNNDINDINTIHNSNIFQSQMNNSFTLKAEQQQQPPLFQSNVFPAANLKNKTTKETKKRTCQSFQAPSAQTGRNSLRNQQNFQSNDQNLDFLDDPSNLAQSAPGNQVNFFQSQQLKQQQQQSADINATSSTIERDKLAAKNQFYEKYSYFSRKGQNWSKQGSTQMNRLVERKNGSCNQSQSLHKNTAWNGRIFNLTLLISIILEKHPSLLYMLSLNHMIGTCARGGLYFLVIVLSGKDVEFLMGFAPLLFFSRLYYTVSMYYLLFYFEQKSLSFRQISKIFNTPFSRLRKREDRTLAAEIINDNMNNTRYHAEIMAKRFFALCPVELNFIALSQITSGRKSNLYYISNFIYQGIESILLYPPVIIYSYLKNTDAQIVGIDFLQITEYASGFALAVFILFCGYLLVCGNKYIKNHH